MNDSAPVQSRSVSMIRSFRLADFITLTNGFAGTAAILAALEHIVSGKPAHLWLAFGLLPFAVICDFLDGLVARSRGASALGAQLDSLADLISFGVAPAVLGFVVGMRGAWDAAVLVYFVGCGLSRLARYNVTAAALSDAAGKVRYYEGTPIPTSLAIVALLAAFYASGSTGAELPLGSLRMGPGTFHPLVLVYLLSGSAMISRIRIPKP